MIRRFARRPAHTDRDDDDHATSPLRRWAWSAAISFCWTALALPTCAQADETSETAASEAAETETTATDSDMLEVDAADVAIEAAANEAAADNNAAAKRDESRFIRARFSDGTILVGELLLDELEVETDFGALVVPRQQLLGLSPGLDSRPGFDERLDGLVAAVASADSAAARAAERELTRYGPAISGELDRRASKLEGDAAKRVAALVERIEAAELESDPFGLDDARPLIRKDRVRTTRFTIVGRIVPQQLRFKSRYGEIEANLADIVAVERQTDDEREDVAKRFAVTGQNLAQTQMKKVGVSVRKGDRIIVRASGMIRRTATTSTYVSSPDGSSRFGTYSTNPQILGGTLIAKIGKNGKPIKVGSNASFIAKQDGTLAFGVAMRPDYVGRYPFPGQYEVKLRVQRSD